MFWCLVYIHWYKKVPIYQASLLSKTHCPHHSDLYYIYVIFRTSFEIWSMETDSYFIITAAASPEVLCCWILSGTFSTGTKFQLVKSDNCCCFGWMYVLVKVCLYSWFSGLYINFPQALELPLSQSLLPGENAVHFLQLKPFT